jgi:hypothetical protein
MTRRLSRKEASGVEEERMLVRIGVVQGLLLAILATVFWNRRFLARPILRTRDPGERVSTNAAVVFLCTEGEEGRGR